MLTLDHWGHLFFFLSTPRPVFPVHILSGDINLLK